MYYIKESAKSFEITAEDLATAVPEQGFGVLHIHDLGNTLRNKGQSFSEECRVFEVCNPVYASKVLAQDIRLNMALPCRISVYTELGSVKVAMILPQEMLTALSNDPIIQSAAAEVQTKLKTIIDKAIQ